MWISETLELEAIVDPGAVHSVMSGEKSADLKTIQTLFRLFSDNENHHPLTTTDYLNSTNSLEMPDPRTK